MKIQNILTIAIIGIAGIISSACGGGLDPNTYRKPDNSPPVATPQVIPGNLSINPEGNFLATFSTLCGNSDDWNTGGYHPNNNPNVLIVECYEGLGNTVLATVHIPRSPSGREREVIITDRSNDNVVLTVRLCPSPQLRVACVVGSPVLWAKPEARPEYNDALVEGYAPKQYFQIGVDSNDTPFGFSTDLQDDGFRQLGFVYGDVRVDYMSLNSQLGTSIDSYRIGYTINGGLFVGIDNYNNGILSTQYNNHTFGAVGGADGYAIRYEYRLSL